MGIGLLTWLPTAPRSRANQTRICVSSPGRAIDVIQAHLGHSNLGTTSRFLAHIVPAEVISVMQERNGEA